VCFYAAPADRGAAQVALLRAALERVTHKPVDLANPE